MAEMGKMATPPNGTVRNYIHIQVSRSYWSERRIVISNFTTYECLKRREDCNRTVPVEGTQGKSFRKSDINVRHQFYSHDGSSELLGERLGLAEKHMSSETSEQAKHERSPKEVHDGVRRGRISQVHSARQVSDHIEVYVPSYCGANLSHASTPREDSNTENI